MNERYTLGTQNAAGQYLLCGGDVVGMIYNHDKARALVATLNAAEQMREALKPLAEIATVFLNDGLDEARPSWGDTEERSKNVEIVSGRGGKTLLTIGDCSAAYAALAAAKGVQP